MLLLLLLKFGVKLFLVTSSSSKPVAITVIPISSLSSPSTDAPKMRIASSPVFSEIMEAISFTSSIPMSYPPQTYSNTALAPAIDVSKSGLSVAALTACWALPSPRPLPTPICAIPRSVITDFTSAKSTFMRA